MDVYVSAVANGTRAAALTRMHFRQCLSSNLNFRQFNGSNHGKELVPIASGN